MNNVKAISLALGQKSGNAEEVTSMFEFSLIKAGFIDVLMVEGQLDWYAWVGACYIYQPDQAPILRKAFKIRWDVI